MRKFYVKSKGVLFDNAGSKTIKPVGKKQSNNKGWIPGYREEIVDESYQEAIKEIIKEEAKQQNRFNKLVNRAGQILFKCKTFSPLGIFPTTITVDAEKITFQMRNFFSSGEIRSIHIKNISHIFVDTGPFFGTLKVVDQSILDNEIGKVEITWLKKEDAKRARRIIQGLIVAHKEEIDVMKIHDPNLCKKLEELGRMQ